MQYNAMQCKTSQETTVQYSTESQNKKKTVSRKVC